MDREISKSSFNVFSNKLDRYLLRWLGEKDAGSIKKELSIAFNLSHFLKNASLSRFLLRVLFDEDFLTKGNLFYDPWRFVLSLKLEFKSPYCRRYLWDWWLSSISLTNDALKEIYDGTVSGSPYIWDRAEQNTSLHVCIWKIKYK